MFWWILKILNLLEIAIAAQNAGRGGNAGSGFNAGSGPGGNITLTNPLACGDFGCIAQAIIGAIFTISIPVTSIMVLIGGFQILTAGGDPERFKRGRQTLIYAAVGFAIILVSGGVVSLIQSLFSGSSTPAQYQPSIIPAPLPPGSGAAP